MRTVAQIRLANLELLITELGTMEAVAEKGQTSSVYLSQLRQRAVDIKTGRPREMGGVIARRLETGTKKQPGWMDQEHADPAQPTITGEAWAFIKKFLALPPEERRVVNRMLGVDEPEPPAAGPFQPVVKDAWSPPGEFLGGNSAFDRNAEEQAEEQFRKQPAKPPVKGRGR